MNIIKFAVLVLVLTFFSPQFAKASVHVRIDLSAQRMVVSEHGDVIHEWAISSGRDNYRTPTGRYRAQWLDRHHRSSRYHNAPMPYSVFFRGNYAIHGTNEVRRLGRPASHGCIRLHTANAAKLFSLVQRHGLKQTAIVISGNASANKAIKHRKAIAGKKEGQAAPQAAQARAERLPPLRGGLS